VVVGRADYSLVLKQHGGLLEELQVVLMVMVGLYESHLHSLLSGVYG
jgi:hypothetical protein